MKPKLRKVTAANNPVWVHIHVRLDSQTTGVLIVLTQRRSDGLREIWKKEEGNQNEPATGISMAHEVSL